ncbi:MAG: aminotransferase class V-fold PLP-dependent enzyme, partial [Nitrospirae bacterium]|nr:aminotransferase class V-fold PLP-dependent enzyme [Nitrospirota bacterium]
MECYFDHVATTPLRPEVLDAMMPYFREEFGNPLSIYPLGTNAREAVEKAREEVAGLINAKSTEIIFTSSGAEANNFALRGIAFARQHEGKHIIVSRMEHHSILNSA